MEMEEVNLNATEHAFGDELVLNQAAFQIDVEIQGFNSGLMLDKYDVASNGDKTGATKTRAQPPKDEAEARLYMSLTGSKKPVIPTVNLMRCLIDAGRQVKVGKRQLSTKSDTLIPGFFVINEPELVIKSNQGWYPNSMGVGVVGGRKIKVRPCFPDWGLKFKAYILPNMATKELLITPEDMYQVFCIGGQSIGIGCYRAEKGGPFGQFRLTKWQVKKAK